MHFTTEDEAFEYYLDICQSECPWDITEDDSVYNWVTDSFLDWVDDEGVTWNENGSV